AQQKPAPQTRGRFLIHGWAIRILPRRRRRWAPLRAGRRRGGRRRDDLRRGGGWGRRRGGCRATGRRAVPRRGRGFGGGAAFRAAWAWRLHDGDRLVRQQDAQLLAFHLRRLLDNHVVLQQLDDLIEEIAPQFGVGELAAAELHRHFDLVALFEEAA